MANIVQFRKNLAPLIDRDYHLKAFFDAVRKTEKILLALNKGQLADGRNIFDEEVGLYTRATELISLFEQPRPRKPKEEGEPFNFEWTGETVDNMYAEYSDEEVEIKSNSKAYPILIGKYKGLFGLDDVNLESYINNQVFPDYILTLRTQLQLV